MSAPAGRLVVVWRITEACDLACWFCEYRRQPGSLRRSATAGEVLAFGAYLAAYAAPSGREVLLSWLGGEPLLWPPLREVGAVLHAKLGLKLGLTTNGTRLQTAGLLPHLTEHYCEVTLSVDGPAAFHDAARGASGLHDHLGRSVAALREARERRGAGPRLRANLVLMRSNLDQFESVCQQLAGWGLDEVTFNALGGQPPGPGYADERLRPDDLAAMRAALPGIRQRAAAAGLTIRGSGRYLGRLERQAAGHPWPVDDCGPGQTFLFVDVAGRVAPCAFTSSTFGVPVSAITSSADLQSLPARFAMRRQQERLPACDDCLSTQVFGKFESDPHAA